MISLLDGDEVAETSRQLGSGRGLRALRTHLQTLRTAGVGGQEAVSWMAFWDFDGTVIDGDITEGRRTAPPYEGMIAWSIKAGLFPRYQGPSGLAQFWQDYEAMLATDTRRAYLYPAELLAELSSQGQAELSEALARLLPEYYQRHFFRDAVKLLNDLAAQGVSHYVVSASPHLFLSRIDTVLPFAGIYGIRRERTATGELADHIVNFAAGKAERVRALLSRKAMELPGHTIRPLLAAGNSWVSDGPMLEEVCRRGGLGIMVNAGPAPAWASSLPIYELELTATLGPDAAPRQS